MENNPWSDLHGRSPRFEPVKPIPVRLLSGGHWQSGSLHNLSELGAFVHLEADLWTGEEVKLVLETPQLPGGHLEIWALAIWKSSDLVREAPAENGYGLLFRHERDGDRRVTRWIDDLQEAGLLTPA